jgi:alkylation response protein AidB-like acyl-CoA dehydrogenase
MMASMAKLKAGRLTREVADSCLQYWGGNGFMWEEKWIMPFIFLSKGNKWLIL